jgi:3-hydroxyisobutyrate dehydrogenase-like beta-hydroxyacid dehydrogenase
METVGVIGLGRMGSRMATNLAESTFETCVYDRSAAPTEPFRERGVPVCATPRAVVERSDAVVIVVSDGDAVLDVLEGDDGVLAALGDGRTAVINASTIGYDETVTIAELVTDAGGRFVDSPVSGTTPQAASATLTVLAAGPDDLLTLVRPVLSVLGEPVIDCGGVGQGTRSKLFINHLLAGMVGSFVEALAFGTSQELDLDHMLAVVASGGMDSPLYAAKGDQLRERDFEPRFTVDLLGKDVGLVLDAGSDAAVPLPVASTVHSVIDATRGLGHGDDDIVALVRFLEANGDVTVRSSTD